MLNCYFESEDTAYEWLTWRIDLNPTITKTKLKSLFLLFLLIPVLSFGEVKLPKLVSDGMVLQRDANVRIWGWAANGEKVAIRFMDASYHATANDKGEWEVMLPKLKAGGPYKMEIDASNTITISDTICLGQ